MLSENFRKRDHIADSPEQAVHKLKQGNETYINSETNNADISGQLRKNTAKDGQKPYAVIVSCSDSRVAPEYIFSAGIGDLFVIRTAGNIVHGYALGSIEFGVKYLGAKIIVILGHSQCGAVSAAMSGEQFEGQIASVIDEIRFGIGGTTDVVEAERRNIAYACRKIAKSAIVTELLALNQIAMLQAKYDLYTGKVEFF